MIYILRFRPTGRHSLKTNYCNYLNEQLMINVVVVGATQRKFYPGKNIYIK